VFENALADNAKPKTKVEILINPPNINF